MALGILNIVMFVNILLNLALIAVLYYRNGGLAQKNSVFVAISVYLALVAGIQATAVPSNDLPGQLLGYGIFIITVAAIFFKKNHFNIARLMLASMLLVSPIPLYWL